jgi:hypothetical protein
MLASLCRFRCFRGFHDRIMDAKEMQAGGHSQFGTERPVGVELSPSRSLKTSEVENRKQIKPEVW